MKTLRFQPLLPSAVNINIELAAQYLTGMACSEGKKGGDMVRSELALKLADEHPGFAMEEIEKIVDLFFEAIVAQLSTGGRVELRGFGSFTTRAREARMGRNPRSGQEVAVSAKRAPHFKPGKEMRDRLKGETAQIGKS